MTESNKLKFKLISKQNLYNGFFQLNKYQFKNELFEGGWSQPFEREIFERGHAVAVLLLDLKNEVVVLVEQFRPGAVGIVPSPWVLELVAGMIEIGESVENVALRESVEEAGCEITRISKICDYLVSPGGCTETICLMLGEVDSSLALGYAGLISEHEDIKVHKISVEKAFKMLDEGIINNAMALIGLQWLKINWHKKDQFWA